MVNVIISPLPRRPRKRRGCLQTNGNYQRKGTAPKIYPFVSLYSDTKDMKAAVLSPSTLRGYAGLLRTHFQGDFGSTRLNELNSQIVQIWISDLSKRLSPKTVPKCLCASDSGSRYVCPRPFYPRISFPPGSTRSYIVRTTQIFSASWLNLLEPIWK